MSPRAAHALVGHAEPFTWRDGLAHMREVTPGALDITDHAEIDAIVAELGRSGREVPRDLVVEIVRLLNGRGSMAAGGKSHLASTEPHECTPAARAAPVPLGVQLNDMLDGINRSLGAPITAAQGDRIVALLTAMAADLHALRAMGASLPRDPMRMGPR